MRYYCLRDYDSNIQNTKMYNASTNIKQTVCNRSVRGIWTSVRQVCLVNSAYDTELTLLVKKSLYIGLPR